MSLARVDLEATGITGVWRSPYPVPLAFLSVTVRSATGGSVFLWWTSAVTQLAGAPPPDSVVSATQAAAFSTARTDSGTLYIADSTGHAFDAVVAADTEPIPSAATTPPQNINAFMAKLTTTANGSAIASQVPLPPGTQALALWQNPPEQPPAASAVFSVTGDQSGQPYVAAGTLFLQWPTLVPVSTALDSSVTIHYTDAGTGSTLTAVAVMATELIVVTAGPGGIMVRSNDPGVSAIAVSLAPADLPLPVTTTTPLHITPGAPTTILSGAAAAAASPGATIITIPANRVWHGTVGASGNQAEPVGETFVQTAGTTVTPPAGTIIAHVAVMTAAGAPAPCVTPDVYIATGNTAATLIVVGAGVYGWAHGLLL